MGALSTRFYFVDKNFRNLTEEIKKIQIPNFVNSDISDADRNAHKKIIEEIDIAYTLFKSNDSTWQEIVEKFPLIVSLLYELHLDFINTMHMQENRDLCISYIKDIYSIAIKEAHLENKI